MFALLPEKRAKWAGRFQWIQMDEVQDTHVSEYEVIRLLATRATGLAFFGDLDQTIYEWRGSKPDEVIERLKADFGSVTEQSRVTTTAPPSPCCASPTAMPPRSRHRRTHTRPAPSLPDGSPPEISHHYGIPHAEGELDRPTGSRTLLTQPATPAESAFSPAPTTARTAVSQARLRITKSPISPSSSSISSAVRKSRTCSPVSACCSIPRTAAALQRMTPAPVLRHRSSHRSRNSGPMASSAVSASRTSPNSAPTSDGDPFHDPARRAAHGTVVVFDVETTGLSPTDDEVIDLGAVKLVKTAARPGRVRRLAASQPPTRRIRRHSRHQRGNSLQPRPRSRRTSSASTPASPRVRSSSATMSASISR